jgi:hypothetical protein
MTAQYRRVRTYLFTAFVVFMAAVLICILIRPDLFDHPDYGISFFGSIRATLIPYTIGILTVVYCMWSIAKELAPYSAARPLRLGYLFGAGCLLGIVLTPMALHPVVWWTHIAISLALLISQLAVCTWILLQKDANWIDYLIGLVFLASGIATFLSGTWPGVLTVYAVSELIVFAANISLLGRAALRFVSQKK